MSVRAVLSVAALAALAPFVAACGGDSKNASEPLPTTPALTVPGDSKTPKVTKRSDTATTDTTSTTTSPATTPAPTQTTAAPSNPSTPSGGAAAPQTGGASPGTATPDTQQNDQAPAAGTPASKFEQFCQDNPGAC